MKTTVELPDELLGATRKYAKERGKTFKEVLIESLEIYIGSSREVDSRPGWESLFGAFKDDAELAGIRLIVDREFSQVNASDWL